MRRHLFLRIVDALSTDSPYFQQRVDGTRRKGLSPLQKCTAAILMLVYGVTANAVDDYVRIGESTTIECLKNFVEGVISVFEDEYLRKPNSNDKGMYMSGYRGVATIVLEVVASSDLWIWHAFFGVSGSNNDINVLDRSPVFDDILNDCAPEDRWAVNRDWDEFSTGDGFKGPLLANELLHAQGGIQTSDTCLSEQVN
ncbi:uncharacterized protein [Arachis hypogaea]|uniref:uncharacterized protein n=1 Tax=Arachis hypogaea TaxID=3818 RepID=UPI0011056D56|nr:uncharacterized protein LOC112742488 [Arachis hypogaea]